MASIKPKGRQFTVKELDSIGINNEGDTLSDGGSLSGKVQIVNVDKDPKVKIRWTYSYKRQGKKHRYYCGTYPNVSMAEIRAKRDGAKELGSRGTKDPRLEEKAIQLEEAQAKRDVFAREEHRLAEAITMSDLFNHWIEEGVRRKENNKGIKAMFNNHLFPNLGNVMLKSLSEKDLIKIYKKLIKEEKYKTTIELHKDVGQMLRWASARKPYRKLLIEGNPSELIDMETLIPDDYTNIRERVLSEEEITKLFDRLKDNPVKENIQMAIWICLSCTCRIGELMMAEWSHVDFNEKTWFIPKENSKGREKRKTDHTVYLSDFALNHFKRLKVLAGESRWCFPAKYTDSHLIKSAASKEIGDRQIRFMNRTSKLKHRIENDSLVIGDEVWTVHDLRRTSSTMIQSLIPTIEGELVAQLCLHHKVITGSARHYLFFQYKNQMRHAWDLLGKKLQSLTYDHANNVDTFYAIN